MITLFISLFITFVIGYIFIGMFFQCPQLFGCHRVVKASLGLGFGFGLVSLVSFILLLIINRLTLPIIFISDVLLLFAVIVFYKKFTTNHTTQTVCNKLKFLPNHTDNASLTKFLFVCLIIMLYIALLMFSLWSRSLPHGGWDAWSLWNANAKFIFLGGDHWRDALASVLLGSSNDYPWMYPVMTSRLWFYAGKDMTLVPILISGIYTFTTVFLLGTSIALIKNKQQAILACIFLLTTPFFIYHASSQFADIPLAYYFLATMVLWQLFLITKKTSLLFLTGCAAGLAMFVKNEGIFFIIMLIINYGISTKVLFKDNLSLKNLRWFLLGISVFIIVNIVMRITTVPPATNGNGITFLTLLLRLFEIERHQIILSSFWHVWQTFTQFTIPVWLLIISYALITGISVTKEEFYRSMTIFLQILFMLFGYYTIYLFISPDIVWHISGSLHRLYVQLWPTFLFFYFLLIQPAGSIESKNTEENHNKNNKNKQI